MSLLDYLPETIRMRLSNRPGVHRILWNLFWLFSDRILRMAASLFVGVWVARYLGPQQYGNLGFAVAFTALIGSFASFGMDSIVIRDLVKKPEETNNLLGTAFALRFFGAILIILISVVSISFLRPGDNLTLMLVVFSSTSFLFYSADTIDLYFQSKVLSKYTVWAKNSAFLLSTGVKIILITQKAPLLYFGAVGLLEIACGAFFIFTVYRLKGGQIKLWHPSFTTAKKILTESWPLILVSISSIINMRVDQIFIGKYLNDTAVGHYSAAVRVAEIWLMIPAILGASIYPSLISAKEKNESMYRKRIIKIFKVMCAVILPAAFCISFFSDSIISLLFGDKYLDAGSILAIYIWTGVPYLTTFAFNQMFYIEGLTRNAFYISIFVPIANIILNIILIPHLGLQGAAVATLIVAFLSAFFSLGILHLKTGIFKTKYAQ